MKPVYDKFITDPKLKDMVSEGAGYAIAKRRSTGAAGGRDAIPPPSFRIRHPGCSCRVSARGSRSSC